VDADVVVVGAGPTGLMLAGELAGRGVRTVLLERRVEPSQVAKAGGLAGQVLQLLHYRGELERFGSEAAMPVPRFPFGGLHLDFSPLGDSPMRAMLLPQPQLEAVLAERAVERGAEVWRGHRVTGLRQDDEAVTLEVEGPDGAHEVRAAFVVGCDGGRSRVRELTGIGFEGSSLPEVERLCSFTIPDGVTVTADGSLEVEGVGTLPFGYTATEHGVFACHGNGEVMGVYTAEVEADTNGGYDDEAASFTVEEMRASVRRVTGFDLPLGEPLRMTRFGYSAKQADRYRDGRVFLAGDAAHLFPAGGVAVNAGMLDAADLGWKLAAAVQGWAPEGLLDTYTDHRRAAAERTLLHTRAQVALRKGFGPGGDALRALFAEVAFDEPALRRLGALMAGTDVGAPPSAGHPLVGTVLTDRALGVDHHDPRLAGLLASSRPVLLDLADRADLHALADGWADRLDVVTVLLENRPADALLVLPDTRVAGAVGVGEPAEALALAAVLGPASATMPG
jgi:2-polyprenyl-6-methoxyphenol hydroxylase-like FAD-dependent oxidoreductase